MIFHIIHVFNCTKINQNELLITFSIEPLKKAIPTERFAIAFFQNHPIIETNVLRLWELPNPVKLLMVLI